ncbi:MAG: hypothetical protein KF778_21980 [Rhodocyclaceae bacterium]|nr:hypothetical protein [Rhodocyclaceae bacterium]
MKVFFAAAAAATAALCLNSAQAANPADYVAVPTVEYGEREIDFKFGNFNTRGEERFSVASVGFGLGVKERWFTELYLKYEREGSEGTKLDAFEWENRFLLTEPGQFPLDIGLLTEIERPRDRAEGYEFRFGPLLQTDFGKVQLNGNLLFERHYRAEQDGPMEMGYQWQVKYRWMRELEFGLQGFGEFGKWDDHLPSDQQSHRVGPAVFGKIRMGERQALKWNAAYLAGTTRSSPDHNFRMLVEYEF